MMCWEWGRGGRSGLYYEIKLLFYRVIWRTNAVGIERW